VRGGDGEVLRGAQDVLVDQRGHDGAR
jgi:hypothetical protein